MKVLLGALALAYIALFGAVSPAEAAACPAQVIDHTHQTASGVSGGSAAVMCKNGRLYTVSVTGSCTIISVTWQANLNDTSEQKDIDRFPAKMVIQSSDGSYQTLSQCTPNPDAPQAAPVPKDIETQSQELQKKIDALMQSGDPHAADEAYKLLKQNNDQLLSNAFSPPGESSAESGNKLDSVAKTPTEADKFRQEMDAILYPASPTTIEGTLEIPPVPTRNEFSWPALQIVPDDNGRLNFPEHTTPNDSYSAPQTFVDPRASAELQGYDPNSRSIMLQGGEGQQQYFDRMWRGYAEPVVTFTQDIWDGFAKLGSGTDLSGSVDLGQPEVSQQTPAMQQESLPSATDFSQQRVELAPNQPSSESISGADGNDYYIPESLGNDTIGIVGEDSNIPLPEKKPTYAAPQVTASSNPEAYNAATLADYYDSLDQELPSLTARKSLAAQYGIVDYNGSAAKNKELLTRLQGR